jgi:hypothetical protein
MKFLGVDASDGNLYTAIVTKKRGRCIINSLAIYLINRSSFLNVKPLYIVSGLPAKDVLVRNILLNIRNIFSRKKTLPVQAEMSTFIDKEQLFYLPSPIPGTKKYAFHMTAKNKIKQHLEEMNKIGLDPHQVSSQQIALLRFARFIDFKHDTFIVMHISKKQTVYVLVNKDTVEATYSSNCNATLLWEAFKKDLPTEEIATKAIKRMNLLSFKEDHFIALEQELSKLREETAHALLYFQKQFGFEKIPLLITGDAHLFLSMDEFVKKASAGIATVTLCPVKFSHFAISIGLALDAACFDKMSLQFRRGEFLSKKRIKKYKKQFLLGIVSLSILFFSFYLVTHTILCKKDKRLTAVLSSLSYKEPAHDKVRVIEDKIADSKKFDVLIVKSPKIQDILKWLLQIKGKDIHLTAFNYHVEKRTANKDYFMKIALEFTAKEENSVKALYKAIKEDEKFICHEKDISLEKKGNNTYELSFFLDRRGK